MQAATALRSSARPWIARGHASAVRVLDVTNFYSPASGGVKTYLDQKMLDFAARPVEHALVVPGRESGLSRVGRSRVYRLKGPTIPFSPAYRFLLSARAVERIVAWEWPQVIEVGSPFLVPRLVRQAIRARPIRTVGFYHSDLARTYAAPYAGRLGPRIGEGAMELARRYTRRVYGCFDVTIAASPVVARELRGIGLRDVRCIPLGVDTELFSPARRVPGLWAAHGVQPGVPVALYVGRFCQEKALDVVLAAQRRLEPTQRPHLVLVGDGPQRRALAAKTAGWNRVTLLPYEPDRERLARLYASADFYVAAGPGETFGLAIAEALASGLPVVAVDSGAAPDRVAGSGCGELYRAGDADDCGRAMRAMIERLSPRLRRAARGHAEARFGWSRTFDALYQLYSELAGNPCA